MNPNLGITARRGGWWKIAVPLLAVLVLVGVAAVFATRPSTDRVSGSGEQVERVDGDEGAPDGFSSTYVGPDSDAADQAVADAALATMQTYLAAAWTDPATSGDPFGYDYSTWIDAVLHPDADAALHRAGPVPVGLDAYNADLDRYVANRHADLRSALWVLTSTPERGDWRLHETDPAFELGPVTAAPYVAGTDFAAADGTSEPIIDRDPDGTLLRVRWPFTASASVKMTVDGEEMIATYTMAATVELWPIDGDQTELRIGTVSSYLAHVNGLSTVYRPLDEIGVGADAGTGSGDGSIVVAD